MSKQAKAREIKTIALPMAGKVTVLVLAVAALGFGLLSRSATVLPLRLPSERQASLPPPSPLARQVENQKTSNFPGRFVRQIVDYDSRELPGTVVVDTENTFLYLVLGRGQAMRYGIGVGREGFGWSGIQLVAKKTEWPDWRPPAEMLSRQPYLPRFMAGGPGNPLGARAMYLGETAYRIHGTNKPETIGKRVSSGCIRLTNEDITDLYSRVKTGAKVVVLPTAQNSPASDRPLQVTPPRSASPLA
jgi:lipoprotein-anchoring transpeptidase ErfK/SrfK